jgi:anti-sigma regulatory factor (Ser/Thr protein kinase)
VNDAIRLTVPHARAYSGVVRLVLGGLAARHDLPYEELEDLQIALETLLASDAYAAGGDVTVEIELADGAFELSAGPLDGGRLESALARDPDEREGIGLRRLLSAVAGGFDVERRDGGEWVRMRKELPTAGRRVR